MSFPPAEFWPGWQWPSEGSQEADNELFNSWVNLDSEEFEYPQAPSTFDERSTILGSELDAPPLTFGPTLTPTSASARSKTSPSLGPPEEPDFHHGLGLPKLNEGANGLGFSPIDKSSLFRHIGENPEIRVQESLSSPPKQLCLDDATIGLSPRSPLLSAGSPAQPTAASMKRGRSNPLPAQKRIKVSTMRKVKACPWCRIHKVEVRSANLLVVKLEGHSLISLVTV